MEKINRRNFLTKFLLSSTTIPLFRSQMFAECKCNVTNNIRPLEMLAIGDSVMWGQGLKDENKFTFLVKKHLEEVDDKKRCVNLFVTAHSGASIENKSDNREKLIPSKTYNGEINLFNPSIKQQAINAYEWYRNPNKIPEGFITEFSGDYGRRFPEHREFYKGNPTMPENVDLILVNGGINDLDVRSFVNPTFPKEKFKQAADKYCNERMKELLEKLILMFPNARVIVPGYFPLLSKETCPDKAIEAMTAAFGSNVVSRLIQRIARKVSITDRQVRDKLADRSSEWVKSANAAMENAVKQTNNFFPMKDKMGKLQDRVFFAKVYPDFWGDENAYGTDLRNNGKKCPVGKENENAKKRSFVWEFTEKRKTDKGVYKIRTGDQLFDTRVEQVCTEEGIDGLKKIDRFICRRAGLFHPNTEGAKAIFESIKKEIDKILQTGG